ncbi:uncharacterized protein K441DRAFT_566274 [Cenococcum geophilum 1.58]|uniref:uncharacterized protein n=1 Tax=Cenococcum geophilum 1.58 TaxID=794803 RepID=UPI00358EE51D|nr:hypothetical protein K441DRAFT_566274 [Cenococcum geophilum 1.58]
MPTPDSGVENRAPGLKGKGKGAKGGAGSAMAKVAKTKVAARRASGASVLGAKKAAVAKKTVGRRKALAEKPNMSDTEEVDVFEGEEQVEEAEPVKELKGAKRGRPRKFIEEESLAEMPKPKRTAKAGAAAKSTKAAPKATAKTAKAIKRPPSAEPQKIIPETQPSPDPMDIEEHIEEHVEEHVEESIEIAEVPDAMPPPPRPAARQGSNARSSSKQLQPHRRAGSTSDTERGGGDPTLRRRLGEMTKKLENINLKYQNVREVGIQEKESNFDRLKRATDEKEKAQDDFIQSLKQQIASLQSASSETSSLRDQLSALKDSNARLVAENKTLTASLTSAQSENKILSTKLAAARSSQPPESKTVPGSAVKQRSVVLPGSAEAAKETQIRQLKEDLYSDLTGLIVRGVKRGDSEDVYDCIQTGRNGTLHFHLAVSSPDPEKPAYEDAEFAYTPLLDENRDKDLLEILPDYLTEEICFRRSHAAKFYAKVVDCMTKRILEEED